MFKKIYFKKAAGADKNARKRGFTLVELTVVMLLSTLIVFMVVSYSRLISDHVKDSRERYDFFEDSATFKNELSEWMSLYDEPDAVFAVKNGKLMLDHYGSGEHLHEFMFRQGTLEIGNLKVENLNSIDKAEFFALSDESGKGIIKCVLSRYDRDGNKEDESVLIFAPNCSEVKYIDTEGGVNE